jgi:hypothetical protein
VETKQRQLQNPKMRKGRRGVNNFSKGEILDNMGVGIRWMMYAAERIHSPQKDKGKCA